MSSDRFRFQIVELDDDGGNDGHWNLSIFFAWEDIIEEEIFDVGGHESGSIGGDDAVEKKF